MNFEKSTKCANKKCTIMSNCIVCGKEAEEHFDLCIRCMSYEETWARFDDLLKRDFTYNYKGVINE